MVGMTERFLTIDSSNDMVKEMSTEELIGRTIPSAAVRLSTLPRNSVDAIERTKECLKVIAKELESRCLVSSEQLLDVMGLD